ncbi:MAG: hypothetical protein KAS72_03280 [Phycisphaerales bacterium]|nr:hypothetical protein [Phycisphaerales bacterium]
MAISVVDPVGRAIARTKLVLFQPFDLGKWFVLGFCAFLAVFGEGGGFHVPGSGGQGRGGGGGPPNTEEITDWIASYLGTIIVIGAIVLLIALAIGALITWLSSRGKFMFLDGIVRNRGAVVEPWKEFRELGNSLFAFSFILGLIGLLAIMAIFALAVAIAWPDLQSGRFTSSGWTAVLGGGGLLIVAVFILTVISLILKDFVVPTMYLRNEPVMLAWATVRDELIVGRVGTIILFYLMKFVLGLAIGMIAVAATCATCCIAAIPYLGTVILLPLYVFTRCYSVCFIEQYGPDWCFFTPDGVLPRCALCGCSLHGAMGTRVCPGCGTSFDPGIIPPPLGL